MNDPAPLRSIESALEAVQENYAGRTRYTQLEYEALLANASIGIAFTRERRVFLCNRRFAELLGYRPDELVGQLGEMVYPSRESYEALGRMAVPILGAGRQLDVEWQLKRKDGSTVLCRMVAKAIDEKNPQQGGTVWIVDDITERRRAAEELQRVLAEQQALLNNVVVGIAFSLERKIVRCNRRFEDLFGFAPGGAIGTSWREAYFSDDEFQERLGTYAELDQGRIHNREQWLRRQDGSGFWCRITARAVEPGKPEKGYVWLLDDISERKRADQALERMVREQDAILQNTLAGIAFIKDRAILRCNRRFEEIFGYQPGELLGQTTRFMFRSDAEFDDAGSDAVYDKIWAGDTQYLERENVRKDGSRIWCSISGRAVQPGDPSQGSVWLLDDITQEHEAEERVQRVLAEQELILDNATVGIAFLRNRVILRCNRFFEEMIGAGPGELVGQSTKTLFASDEEWRNAGEQSNSAQPGEAFEGEARFRRHDGSTFLCRVRGRRIDAGEPEQEWIWSYEDVTLKREADTRVKAALAEQELILRNATIGIAFVRNRRYQRCNARLEEMFGYGPGDMLGSSTEIVFRTRQEFEEDGKGYERLAAGESVSIERQYKRKDGSLFWCKVVGRAIDPQRPQEGSIWIYDDVTAEHAAREALERAVAERTAELQEAQARAQHLADHDALTGLPNRRLLEDRLTQALAMSQRNREHTAVMFVDLDRFKHINDSLGHAAGDLLLKEVSQRLINQLRTGDTICRIGGDEFVLVLPQIKRTSDVAQIALKVIEQLSAPVVVEDRELVVTSSIGIAVSPDDGRDAETLIRNADAAMYHAKEAGRANYQFFTEQMNQAASRRIALESDLRRGVSRSELRVHYQRFVDRDGATAGHEALLRWQHPKRGLVQPADFIQLAEETGLILRMGEWALREACRWGTSIGVQRGLQVAVNLSPRQFNDPNLPRIVSAALKESGLPPRLLELEITESLAMRETDTTLATLRRLKKLGVSIAIDDFGTGYSSLAYLKRFPVDKLKIDRSFVAELPGDREQCAIVSAIVALAHALNVRVIAEGVEEESQREFLARCGCDFIQGYLVGRPQDAAVAAKAYL